MMRPVTILARRTHTPTVCPRNQPRIVPRPRSKRVVSRTVRALRLSGRRRTERKHAGEHCLRSRPSRRSRNRVETSMRRQAAGARLGRAAALANRAGLTVAIRPRGSAFVGASRLGLEALWKLQPPGSDPQPPADGGRNTRAPCRNQHTTRSHPPLLAHGKEGVIGSSPMLGLAGIHSTQRFRGASPIRRSPTGDEAVVIVSSDSAPGCRPMRARIGVRRDARSLCETGRQRGGATAVLAGLPASQRGQRNRHDR
jgi:hypothetical protein